MDTVDGIRLFIRVVETGSFSKAAAGMGITQPTATKYVAALEARLGARLFHRSTRGTTATELGAAYYDKCKTIARELEEADSLAALMQARVQGTLRISTSVAFGRRVLTPLVLRFMQQQAAIDDREAYGNLNMGAGFALFVAAADAPRVIEIAAHCGVPAWNVGMVEAGVKRVVIEPLALEFSGADLHVRA